MHVEQIDQEPLLLKSPGHNLQHLKAFLRAESPLKPSQDGLGQVLDEGPLGAIGSVVRPHGIGLLAIDVLQGVLAIESLITEGININATLIFSLAHYEAVAYAYIHGLERNPDPHRVASVASFFVSRIDTVADRVLDSIGTPEALALRGKAAIASSKRAYHRFREIFYGEPFAAQRQRGARVQRTLWGSTSTKNPAYSDVLYVEELIGPDTVNTIPLTTLNAFRDHGRVRPTLLEGIEEAESSLTRLAELGVDLNAITEQLLTDGVAAFADSFDQLLSTLTEKRRSS